MIKNNDFNLLPQRIEELIPPENYFTGIRSAGTVVPRNILCFAPKNWHSDRAQHYRFVLILALTSWGHVAVDEHVFSMEERNALLIFPFQRHSYVDMTLPAAWLLITFELADQAVCAGARNRLLEMNDESTALTHSILDEYTAGMNNSMTSSRLSLLTGLLVDTLAENPRPGKSAPDLSEDARFLDRVNFKIFQQHNRPVSIAQLAAELFISESHLRLKFRKVTGKSLGRFIRETRMHRAWNLLATTDMSITECAYACGYDTVYAFSRAFKTHTGQSPRAYRKFIQAHRHNP